MRVKERNIRREPTPAEEHRAALLRQKRRDLVDHYLAVERRKSVVFAHMSDAYVFLDREFRYVDLNRAAERHLGRRLAALRGKRIWDEFPEIIGTRFEEEYRRAMLDGRKRIFEEYFPPFGQWLEIAVFPEAAGISVFYRDVTDRKRALEPLREMTTLLEQTYDAIFIWNIDNGIVSWNANAERLYGYTTAEAIGRRVRELLRTEYPTTYDRFLNSLWERGVWEGELIQVTKSGERVIVEGRMNVIRKDNDGLLVLETAHDVTERRRLESKLARSSRLALIGELAAGLAHEIKNPLAGIKGVVDILLERRKTCCSDEKEVLESVREEIDRIDGTVRTLLSAARPKPIDPAPAAIDDTVRRAAKLASYQFQNGDDGIEIKLDLPPRHVIVPHDESGIEDAVLNLVINAGEALRGTIGGRVLVRLEKAGDQVKIHVSDNGPGIVPESHEEIFQPFNTSKIEGTGLGLTAVKRIARAHGGDCLVESIPGHGATFTIIIPFTRRRGKFSPKK